MIRKIFVFILLFLVSFIWEIEADTIYLKNGRSMEGLITEENEERVVLDIGFGKVGFRKEEIESIYRSSPEEVVRIRQGWQRQEEQRRQMRIKREQELEEARRKKELEPKEVEFSQTREHIIVDAVLNKKVKASLLLDTGASAVLLSSRIAKKLGIKTRGLTKEKIEVKMADGHKVEARYVVLDSVNIQGAEVSDVAAVVLSEEAQMDNYDGLLGMSFLNKFNFRIDIVDKRLILEKPK